MASNNTKKKNTGTKKKTTTAKKSNNSAGSRKTSTQKKRVSTSQMQNVSVTNTLVSNEVILWSALAVSILLFLGDLGFGGIIGDEQIYQTPVTEKEEVKQEVSETKLSWEEQKKAESEKRKRQNEIKKIEEEIEDLETKIASIDEQYLDPEISKNSAKLNELSKERETLENRLMECMEIWEELSC